MVIGVNDQVGRFNRRGFCDGNHLMRTMGFVALPAWGVLISGWSAMAGEMGALLALDWLARSSRAGSCAPGVPEDQTDR